MTLFKLDIIDEHFDNQFKPTMLRFSKLGFCYVSHGIVDPDNNVSAFFSDKKWAEKYKYDKFSVSDPCLRLLMNTDRHMALWDAMPRDYSNADVMQERNHSCGIADGMSLYYRYSSGMKIIVGLGVKEKDQLLEFLLHPSISELHDLVNSMTKIHNRVQNLLH